VNYQDFGITIPPHKHSGEVVTTCPKCSESRKKKSDKCLGINLDKQVWRCNHCGWSGHLPEERERIVYVRPIWKNKTELSDKVVKWFEGRGIGQVALTKLMITQGREFMPQVGEERSVIEFNYFRGGELVNVKYRDGQKNFKLFKDAELILYNLDSIAESDECYVVEGEMDVLSLVHSGVDNVASVPNGANLKTNNLTYLDNCYESFANKKRIILATDNDQPGRRLRDELAERLGVERCVFIDFGTYKDFNEVFMAEGIEGVHRVCGEVRDFPIEGVFGVNDISLEIRDMYENGLDRGVDIMLEGFDLSIVKGYITTITGIPSHGKSEVVDTLSLQLRKVAGWKGAFYSPENKPTQLHISKLARKIVGKNWDGIGRMSIEEVESVIEWLDGYFWFIKPEEDFSLATILDSVKRLKLQHGIDYFVIDAWNKLEHKYSNSETKYIGESLDSIALFCERLKVHCFLVAHPTKMRKEKDSLVYPVPTLYDISGSSNFFNKTDNGISVYRDFTTGKTSIHRQKIKFDHWGTVGMSEYFREPSSGRYYTSIPDRSNWLTGKTEVSKWVEEIQREPLSTKKEYNEDLF